MKALIAMSLLLVSSCDTAPLATDKSAVGNDPTGIYIAANYGSLEKQAVEKYVSKLYESKAHDNLDNALRAAQDLGFSCERIEIINHISCRYITYVVNRPRGFMMRPDGTSIVKFDISLQADPPSASHIEFHISYRVRPTKDGARSSE